ncbi:hypothetical protein [Novosphingobium sp. PASSN1]|uniref:hypothetical protein n=1 Tax=Novosphingobium sp. PASSN1 TaxID=2015561 RepID=UPI000BC71E63|nr:hypothetical protein [Novosphingobium sp. PASSN1]OYU37045.1 MAG: hypothetical protein CFE35_01290 [Novosphingobium sp. PASSN1]
MLPKNEAPAGAGATRDKLAGGSHFSSTFTRPAAQLPRLIALHLGAETLAALALFVGGQANG